MICEKCKRHTVYGSRVMGVFECPDCELRGMMTQDARRERMAYAVAVLCIVAAIVIGLWK